MKTIVYGAVLALVCAAAGAWFAIEISRAIGQ